MTAFAAGLRASELCRLKTSDIDSKRMCLRVDQGKGCKDRYVPLSVRLLEQLRDYWRRASPPAQWLFSGHPTDRAMTRSGPSWIYRTAAKKANINKPGGIHTLRHNYATGLLEDCSKWGIAPSAQRCATCISPRIKAGARTGRYCQGQRAGLSGSPSFAEPS